MRPQPLICCRDVEASSRWYQSLLGLKSGHGGPHYERLETPDGRLVMQLHEFETDHDHGPIGDADDRPYGNGVILWFELDDFDAALARAIALGAEILIPKRRDGPDHWQVWLRDPDGYKIVLASPDGSAAG